LTQEANKYSAKRLQENVDSATIKANQTKASFKRSFKRCHEAHADLAAAICVHREKVRYFIHL
jgi:deoxyribose-phosphate aldolase